MKDMEWVDTKQAIQICKEKGRDISRPGIIYVGLTHQFAKKDIDGIHWKYLKSLLLKWLDENNIGEEWETVKQASERYGVHISKIYNFLKFSVNMERRKYKNAVVFRKKEFDEYYEKYRRDNDERKKGN